MNYSRIDCQEAVKQQNIVVKERTRAASQIVFVRGRVFDPLPPPTLFRRLPENRVILEGREFGFESRT
jgi:hypothetical protein